MHVWHQNSVSRGEDHLQKLAVCDFSIYLLYVYVCRWQFCIISEDFIWENVAAIYFVYLYTMLGMLKYISDNSASSMSECNRCAR